MRHLFTIAFLIAAVVLAILGSAGGPAILIGIALLFEALFWYRLVKNSGKPSSTPL